MSEGLCSRAHLVVPKLGVNSLSGMKYFIMTTMVTYQVPITLSALQPRTSSQNDHNAETIVFLTLGVKTMFVPGILLKADLFGYGERKNNQDCSDNDGKFAVHVPMAADCAL